MVTTHPITAADLEAMGSDSRYELYRGVLHAMSPSRIDPSVVGMRLAIRLGSYIYEHELGVLSGENGGYLLERDPDTVISPDVGFVRSERRALWPGHRGFFPGPPDLAIEIISPSDETGDIRRKQAVYDRVAVPLVWRIDPSQRTATVYKPGQQARHLTASDSLDGEDVVPGFSLPLATLFDF